MKGVLQGSVLGSLLNNTYVSDLAAIANQCKTSLPSFAYVMTMYCSGRTPQEACHIVSSAMSVLIEAITDKGLAVNNDKTVSKVIRPTSSLATSSASGCSDIPVIQYNGNRIMQVTKTRLLGVTVDHNLSWNDHVDPVCLKLGRKTGVLRRTFRQLTPAARRMYFISVIQPDLEYAAMAIFPTCLISIVTACLEHGGRLSASLLVSVFTTALMRHSNH